MVFALQMGNHRIVGAAETDVSLLRKNRYAGEKPFGLFGSGVIRRIVRQEDIHIHIRVLNTSEGVRQFITAVIQHQAGGKN